MELSDDQHSQCSKRSRENLQNIEIKAEIVKSELQQLNDDDDDDDDGDDDDDVNSLWDYEEILGILGFGKTQWILLLVCGLLIMTSVAAAYSVGIISISSQCEFNISQTERGVMMAACVTGTALSTYIWGVMSDVWGRRTILIWSMFFTNFLQLILMFVTNIWLYNFINLIMGLSLGGILGPIYPYLSEFNIAKYRPIAINYSNMFISVTEIYVPAISWLVLSSNWSFQITETFTFKPWRLILLFGMLPGLIGGLVLLSYPESPKLLLAHGRHKEALKALYWISRFNTGKKLETILKISKIHLKSEELADANLFKKVHGFSIFSSIWKATLPLFHKPYGIRLTMALVVFLGLMFCLSGMKMWFPEIVNRLAADGSQWRNSSRLCEIINASYQQDHLNVTNEASEVSMTCDDTISNKTYVSYILMGLSLLIGYNIQGPLLRFLDRKYVLISCLCVGSLCNILLNFITSTTGILILFCMIILIPVLAISNMCSIIVDLVPTHLRGKSVSLGFTLGRISTVVATNVVAAMLTSHCTELFAINTGIILVCGSIIYYLPI